MAQPKQSIPIIDPTPLLSPHLSDRHACALQILSAFRTHGFLYLHHPTSLIPTQLLTSVFQQSALFFALPQPLKDSLAWTNPIENRGYVSAGREKVSHSLDPEQVALERETVGADMKESFEIGRDNQCNYPNHWPPAEQGGTEFKTTMTEFWTKCKSLHSLLMSALALALNLEETFFEQYLQRGDNNLRLLHYPPAPKHLFHNHNQTHQTTNNPTNTNPNPNPTTSRIRAGAHTDYGSITLLWQDASGGLQVQPAGEGGEWIDVDPIPGTVIVNAGDLLGIWLGMGGGVRSTRHRVVEPPSPRLVGVGREGKEGDGGGEGEEGDSMWPARYSVVYFCNPDYETVVEGIPGIGGGGGEIGEGLGLGNAKGVEIGYGYGKVEPVRAGEYLLRRLTATY